MNFHVHSRLQSLTADFVALFQIQLHISRNSFPEGDIPGELYLVTSLQSLAMSYNGFEGSISSDIIRLSNLEEFWAGSNDITGSLPREFGQLTQLRSLV